MRPTMTPVSDFSPGTFGCHEALDRSAMLAGLADELADHPAITMQPAWKEMACAAAAMLSNLYQAIGRLHLADKEPDKQPRGNWHGTYLSEDEIVADMLAKIRADQDTVETWLDPISWRMPFDVSGNPLIDAPDHAGSLMFMGMSVRNHYGLWHDECPHSKSAGDDIEITDGVVTDPRHPDNFSARIIERVRAILAEDHRQSQEK